MSAHYNTTIDDVMKHSIIKVDPVPFQYINALVESSRLAHNNMSKGVILSCRTPDLVLKYNRITSSVEWQTEKPGKQPEKGRKS
jgi:hypothetical protein